MLKSPTVFYMDGLLVHQEQDGEDLNAAGGGAEGSEEKNGSTVNEVFLPMQQGGDGEGRVQGIGRFRDEVVIDISIHRERECRGLGAGFRKEERVQLLAH